MKIWVLSAKKNDTQFIIKALKISYTRIKKVVQGIQIKHHCVQNQSTLSFARCTKNFLDLQKKA
jgi:hypothetical protein